jgi:hypothetical protein
MTISIKGSSRPMEDWDDTNRIVSFTIPDRAANAGTAQEQEDFGALAASALRPEQLESPDYSSGAISCFQRELGLWSAPPMKLSA